MSGLTPHVAPRPPRRFGWRGLAGVFFALALQGCSFVDHDQVAEDALKSMRAMQQTQGLSDEQLSPRFVRAVLQREEDSWAVVAAQFGGIAEVPSATRARIEARAKARGAQ